MATRQYKLDLDLVLEPRWHRDPPLVTVCYKDQIHWHGALTSQRTIEIGTQESAGSSWVSVEMTNKTDQDCVPSEGLDKAVIIRDVRLNGICDPRFVWQGLYTPHYPDHMQHNNPGKVLQYHNYLGWNGPWTLHFELPIFTWIHKIRNLGWIYP